MKTDIIQFALINLVIIVIAFFIAGKLLIKTGQNTVYKFLDNLKQITPQNKATEDTLTPDVRLFLADMFSVDPNNIKMVDRKDFIFNDADLFNKINDKNYLNKLLVKAIADENYEDAEMIKLRLSKLENTPPTSENNKPQNT